MKKLDAIDSRSWPRCRRDGRLTQRRAGEGSRPEPDALRRTRARAGERRHHHRRMPRPISTPSGSTSGSLVFIEVGDRAHVARTRSTQFRDGDPRRSRRCRNATWSPAASTTCSRCACATWRRIAAFLGEVLVESARDSRDAHVRGHGEREGCARSVDLAHLK